MAERPWETMLRTQLGDVHGLLRSVLDAMYGDASQAGDAAASGRTETPPTTDD